MFERNTDRDWEKFSATNPYFAVCTDPKFMRARLDDVARKEFFASGEGYVESMFSVIRERVDADFAPRTALDFGCGVGRVLVALATRCASVTGVDVAEPMLREARANLDSRGLDAVLLRSDDRLSNLRQEFDLVHSVIVLQHIPPRRGEAIARRLVGLLRDGGVGVLQLTYARRQPMLARIRDWTRKSVPLAHEALNVLGGHSPSEPQMQMNDYDLNRMFQLLQGQGCGDVYARFTDHGGHLGAFLFFRRGAVRPL